MIKILEAVPSNREVAAARTERTVGISNGANFGLVKSIAISTQGTYRIAFVVRSQTVLNGATWNIRVYKNDAPVGTSRAFISSSTDSTTKYTTYVEDIGGWKAGDACQIYAQNNVGGAIGISGFVLYAEYQEVPPGIPSGGVLTDASIA